MLELSDNDQKEAVTEMLQQIISSINSLSKEIEDKEKQNENFRAENYQDKKLSRWTQQNRRVREKKMENKAI